jgi:hypothetical protein
VGKLGWAREDDAPINLGIPSMLAVARLPHRWRPLRGAFMATRPWTRIRAGAGLVPAPPGARSCRRTRTTPETSRRYSSPWEALSRQRASPCGRSPACAGERRAERRHRGGRQQHGLGEGEPPIVRQAMSAPLLVLDDVGQEGAARETPRGSRSREPVVSRDEELLRLYVLEHVGDLRLDTFTLEDAEGVWRRCRRSSPRARAVMSRRRCRACSSRRVPRQMDPGQPHPARMAPPGPT